jgi:AcrR family transcriptional regulator
MVPMNITKDQLADCFEKHFNHFGFKKTSVDEVSKELKISKKTIYQFFNSKEEIFQYIVSRIARDYSLEIEQKLTGIMSYHEKLSTLLRMIFSESRKWFINNDAFAVKHQSEIAVLAFQEAYLELIRKIIIVGNESKEFNEVPIDITMRFINGLIAESMKILYASPKINVEDDLTRAVFKLVH